MGIYYPNKKNKELFELLDKMNQCNENILYNATRHKSNRLNHIEDNAIQIEKLAILIQEKIKELRRK